MSIENNYNETFIARLAAREKQQQQHFRPVISVHKWFARRPGSLFRALALAELVDSRTERSYSHTHLLQGVCLDPFMGGGTPIFEASRLGMSVIGYDTNPMATWVVERELEDVDPDQLREAGERIASGVEQELKRFYETDCPACGEKAEVRYFLWLRHHRCVCGREHPLLADTMLVSTGLKRHPREVHICSSCLTLAECKPGKRPRRCRRCGGAYDAGLTPPDSIHSCPCGQPFRVPPQGTIETPAMRLVAVEYHCSSCQATAKARRRTYKTADAHDHDLLAEASALAAKHPSRFWPDELIPSGSETDRLLRWGYLRWMDLFNPRQLLALAALAAAINKESEGAVRRALQTAFSDLLRYQNMLCRYDRQALKPTDVFALHGFPVPRVACEPHMLGERGRASGGFRHILAKYERAKRWCREPYETVPDETRIRRTPTPTERVDATFVRRARELRGGRRALLRRGSLRKTDLPADTVDLVLTDPPYYANVQYAELMEFCYVWLRRLAPDTPYFDIAATKTDEDAVGSSAAGGVDLTEFTHRLSRVFVAAARALKPGGPFIFTYHHNELDAYAPLVVACLDAGLIPTRLYGCPSEMRASRHIHGRNASTVDTVFVLRKEPVPADVPHFTEGRVSTAVAARVAALQRAGLMPTAADRACIRHSVLAVRSMVMLAEDWDPSAPIAERVALAMRTLAAKPLRAAVTA